jgi:hypothetical protein
MLTQDELAGLVELLNRMPMSTAEKLWLQIIINRLAAAIAKQSAPVDEPEVSE